MYRIVADRPLEKKLTLKSHHLNSQKKRSPCRVNILPNKSARQMSFPFLTVLQLLWTFISATALHNVLAKRPFLTWLSSHSFTCWLPPTNQELTALKKGGGGSTENKKTRQRNKARGSTSPNKDDESAAIFKISAASLDSIKLNKKLMTAQDFEILHNSYDLEWIVDLATMTFFNYMFTEIAFSLFSRTTETNLSHLWLLVVISYCVLNLWRLTRSYFANEESSGERSICIVSFCVFMLIAMLVLVVEESKLEFGLETAYKSFNKTATAFIRNHTLTVSDPKAIRKPISFLFIKFGLAILCALTGMVFTFPGFRYAQLHKQLMADPETSKTLCYLTMFNFASPIMVTLLWVKPVSRDFWSNTFEVDDATFDTCKIYFILFVNLVRFSSLPHYVTVFFKTVHVRVKRLRRRGGSITNKEVQVTVSSIYSYVNVIMIQYLLPVLMCLSTVMLYKSFSGHLWVPPTWTSDLAESAQNLSVNHEFSSTSPRPWFAASASDDFGSVADNVTAQHKIITLQEIKGVFTYDVCQGVLGFVVWWLHFSWFITSLAGIVYHTYFMQ